MISPNLSSNLSPDLSPDLWRRAFPDALLALALGALAWAVYHRALGLWLTYDDFFHLHYLYTYSPREYLFVPEIWQRLPFKMITPLLFLSFDLDLALFGLDARAFLVHQLASFAVCVAALYLVLRLWLEKAWAGLAAVLFLLGPVVTGIAPLLMVRHYIETTTLGLAAVGLYVLALRRAIRPGERRAAVLSWISGGLYLAAMLAKEIAVPLAFFLPLLPEGSLRERLRRAVPHAVALVLYFAYRVWMLGTLAGGYGWIVDPADLPRLALTLPFKTGVDLLGTPSAANGALLACLLAGLLAAALQGPRAALLIAVSILLALLPILPVSADMKPRYALPAWLVLVAGFPFGARALARRPGALRLAGAGLAAIAVAGAVFCHLEEREIAFARLERMSAENRAFLRLGPGDLLRQPGSPPATMGELAWMKTDVFGGKPGAGWFYDDFYLCERRETPARVWGYDPVARRMEDMTARVPALRRRYCSTIRRRAPLSVEMHASGPRALYWHLGPYREGRYAFVFGDGVQAFEMPASGGFQLKQVGRLSLRVRYESPEGWVTYSPELDMDFTRQPSYRWARRAHG